MSYQRGDIVEVVLVVPSTGRTINGPAIIISNNEVDNDCYNVIMLTPVEYNDRYSYRIESYMFLRGNNTTQHSEARCHLVTYILSTHIVAGERHRLKKQYVDEIVGHMAYSALK